MKQEWVAALRSGRYKQGRLRLRDEDTFCCLGVLCEIFPGASQTLGGYAYNGATVRTSLPDEMRMRLGMSTEDMNRLMIMNDEEGKTFDEIADWIEESL